MFKLKSLKTSGFKRLDLTEKLEFPDGRLLIHGRNESGKSTILESIHYALYGTALRPNKRASKEDIIKYGRPEAVVELEFTIDDEEYQIRRVLKRKGSNQHLLNKRGEDGELSRVSTGATIVNNQILEILHGIDSDALLNSCLVEQKRLDNIENSNRQERIKAMSSLLNMEAFVDAREKLRKDQTALDKSNAETKQRLQRAKRASEDYTEATDRLSKAQTRLEKITEEKETAQKALEKLEQELKIILEMKQVKENIDRNDTRLEGRLANEKLIEESLEQIEKAEANISDLEKQVPEAEKEYENATVKLEVIEDLLEIQDKITENESALKLLSVKLEDSNARHEEANTATQKMAEINEKIVDYEKARRAEEVISSVQATLMEYIEVQRDAKQIETEISGIQERLDKQIGAENRIKALENKEAAIEKEMKETQNKKTVSIVLMALGVVGLLLFRMNIFFPLLGMVMLGAGVFLFTQSKIEPLEASRNEIRVEREANIGDIARMVEYREALNDLESRQLQPSEILTSLDSQIKLQLMDLPDKPRDYSAFINLTEPSTIDEVRAAIQEDLRNLAGYEAERDSYKTKAETLDETIQTLKSIEDEVTETKKIYDEYKEALTLKEKDSEVQVEDEQKIRKLQQEADRSLTKLKATLKQSKESIDKKSDIEKRLQLTREEMGKLLEVIKEDTEKLELLLKEHELKPEDERKTRRNREENLQRFSSLTTEEKANNRAVEDSTIVIQKTEELSKEYTQLLEQAENELFQLDSMKKAIKLLDTTRDSIMGGVKQNVEKNMMQFLPTLTDNRYNMAQIDETNYRINVYDRDAKHWRGKGVFSGATQDQFSLALRLAFAISTIPQTRGARPGFIFLDEPLSGFDAQRRDGFMLLLKEELSKHFHQIIVISHIEELREDFQHHITLDSGKIIEVQR